MLTSFRSGGMLASETEQALHNFMAAVRALHNQVELGRRLFVGHGLAHQFRKNQSRQSVGYLTRAPTPATNCPTADNFSLWIS